MSWMKVSGKRVAIGLRLIINLSNEATNSFMNVLLSNKFLVNKLYQCFIYLNYYYYYYYFAKKNDVSLVCLHSHSS